MPDACEVAASIATAHRAKRAWCLDEAITNLPAHGKPTYIPKLSLET